MNASRTGSPTLVAASDPSTIARVVAALQSGAVAAIPTDTVYGLAAALDRPDAMARLYQLKSRPHEKAIPVLLADVSALARIAVNVPENALALMKRFWPGALTVVVPARPDLPSEVTSHASDGIRTVAVRIPNHAIARMILKAAGGALAVTSANRSGDPPALDARAVMGLGDAAPEVIVDGGPAPIRTASTVVLAVGEEISILREGAIAASAIAETVLRAAQGSGRAPHAV